MKRYILNTSMFLMSFATLSQNSKGFQWIQHHGDGITKNDEKVEAIQTDRWGNIYVAGQVNDLFVRDSSGTNIKSKLNPLLDSLENYGGLDVWLAKYDPQGNLLWHRYAGSGTDDKYYDMVTDNNGNCYISGKMLNSTARASYSFGRSPLLNDELGTFVAKVDANGNLLWHKPFGGDTMRNVFIEYLADVYNLKLNKNGTLSTFIIGGGQTSRGFQRLFDLDSLDLGVHEIIFDLNGNYVEVHTFPFPRFDRLPQITSIQSSGKGYFVMGILDRDTVFVGSDTVLKTNFDNAISISFDTNLNYVNTFRTGNYFDQFQDSKVQGDTLVVTGHFDLVRNSTVNFDTISYTGNSNESQAGGIFLFKANTNKLIGFYPSKSIGFGSRVDITSAHIDQHSFGVGGIFDNQMTFSGTSNYIAAVSKCTNCNNTDLFFALLDRQGNLIAEDVIYTSALVNSAVFAMHRKDSMLYIGGFVGDSVIIEGVDTFITRGSNDAFVAAYNVGLVTSIKENSTYIKADNGILAYPNPTQGQVTLMGKALNNEAQLFNISGQLVKTYALDQNAFQQTINLENVERGVYFLLIIGENEKQTVKIVKQ
jgi:hypothetical protein